MTKFHLAFPCHDLLAAKVFYCEKLGFKLGRSSSYALIINCYNNQLVAHKTNAAEPLQGSIYPRHFGVIFDNLTDYQALIALIKSQAISFHIEPKIRFKDLPIEHHSFFIKDPSNNLLEFKYYRNESAIFGQKEFQNVGEKK